MYTITINGNTPEELFANLEKMANLNKAAMQSVPDVVQPNAYPVPVAKSAVGIVTQQPIAPDAGMIAAAQQSNTFAPTAANTTAIPAPVASAAVPTSAPNYTLDDLARAGGVLAQTGKMQQATALLAKYGVASIHQLNPEHYGAFATDLRALGAQI